MKVKKIVLVQGQRIPAVRPGEGYGVMVILEPSQIDRILGPRFGFPARTRSKRYSVRFSTGDEFSTVIARRRDPALSGLEKPQFDFKILTGEKIGVDPRYVRRKPQTTFLVPIELKRNMLL